jgi:hypothetical protein
MVYDPTAPGWNEGRPWSDADLVDLTDACANRDPLPEIAVFL